jgi:CRP-like cAMP-binding protein
MQQGGVRVLSRRELEKSPLFQGIQYEEYLRMLTCFQAVQKSFRPDDLIYDFSEPKTDAVGIIERGNAVLIRIDEDGVSTVMEELGPGGVFGKTLAFAGSGRDSLEVVCRTPCDVVFIDYPHILKRCENACLHHSLLVQNMLRLMSGKAQGLSERVDVLSRRSIREKLLCYFRLMAEKETGDSFTLPFSLSTLADYIATDRSAMMRELKRLKEEDLIISDGRKFTLLS